MEETKQLKSSLGIIAFVLSILGFFTGCIGIGIIFDIIAIIIGIIAIVSKKNKNGLAIAGVTISTIGIIFVVFFFAVFNGSDKTKNIGNNTNNIESTEKQKDKQATFGSIIEVGDFTVVFNSSEVVGINNPYATVQEAVVIPTTITNTSDQTKGMMFGIHKTVFTPSGTEAGSDSQIYLNNQYPSYWHDELRGKSTLQTYLVFDYSGDGEYIVEIDDGMFGEPVEVQLNITK